MGKSRSATVLLAYLLWITRQRPSTAPDSPDMVPLPPEPLSVVSALTLLRQGRPVSIHFHVLSDPRIAVLQRETHE